MYDERKERGMRRFEFESGRGSKGSDVSWDGFERPAVLARDAAPLAFASSLTTTRAEL